jgi:acyl-CoA reductase-like NAD-dependent aldehyde dehydrogenase
MATRTTGRRFAIEDAQRHWIGGDFAASLANERMLTVDPSTGEPIASVPLGAPEDVERAVEAAKDAQRQWVTTPLPRRMQTLRALADRVREHREELAYLDALDSGNPIREMRKDVEYGAWALEYFAGLVPEVKGQTVPASLGNLHYTVREPFGVVGRILPYNHPALFMCAKSAAPLAAGNAVVVKPADQTPLSALRIAALSSDILPPGLLNVVTGDGASTGRSLVRHPGVERVAFTGGVETGKAVLHDAADGVKEVTLELGGKNPMIVMPDADLARAVEGAVAGMNFHISAGQSCGSNSRILLHESVHDAFLDQFLAAVSTIRLGPAVEDDTEMGPLISAAHRERVLSYIEAGRSEGARQLTDGPTPAHLNGGFFVQPTVFADVEPGMRIAREEIFGPVVSVMRWSDEQTLLELANGVDYGLTANIWTNDLRSAHRLAAAVQAGYVWINGDGRHYPGTPWGGYKQSGLGREESMEEIYSFTREKTVHTILQ